MKSIAAWEECVLSNGLTFLYRQTAGIPLSAGTLLLRTGSRYERPDQAGLASLTAELLFQGTRKRTSKQIAEEVESGGASMGIHAAEDYTQAGFVTPIGYLDRVLAVLVDALTQPSFPADEIEKERDSTFAALKSRKDSIFNFTYDAFNERLFGSHPYSRPIDGRSETVKRFKREDLKIWHELYIRPDRTIFSLVGSLPKNEATRLVEKHLGRWEKSNQKVLEQTPAPIKIDTSLRDRLKARFEQGYLMTGVLAPSIHEPDYLTLKILNTLLGSGMSSRLFLRLREELGLAYEVSSFSPAHIQTSQWVVYIGTPPEKLSFAKKEMERILDTLARKGPTRAEVEQAVSMINGAYLMEHQTRRRQAWYAAWWRFLGRSPNHGLAYLADVQKITPQAVHTLARRLLAQPRVTVEVSPK